MTPDSCNRIQLIPLSCSSTLDEHGLQLLLEENHVRAIEGPVWDSLRLAIEQIIAFLNRLPREAPWGSYLVADAATREVVGICGFKDAPANGLVEIAYYIFLPYEGRGYVTGAAAALASLADSSPLVRTVIAHTLIEPNASTRVLTKCGFSLVGEVDDPEDGRIWKWERHGPRIGHNSENHCSSAGCS